MNPSLTSNSSSLKKWPFLLWGFELFVGFVLYRMEAPLAILTLVGLASILSLLRHKAAYTLSATLWLFISYQTARHATEPILWLLPVLSITCAFLTFYFTQFPYINSRTSLLGKGIRVDFQGKATLRRDEEGWTGQVESISTSGMSVRGDFGLKIGEHIEVEIPELNRFRSTAKIVGVNNSLLRVQFTGLTFGSVAQHLKVRQHVRSTIKSKAGYSLLEVMIVAGAGSILMLAANQIFMDTSSIEKKAQQNFWIENLKSDILSNIRHPAAWKQTLGAAKNTSAACLAQKLQCNPVSDNGPLAIYDANGKIIFDATLATSGFDPNGKLCDTYDTGANDCRFRFDITWAPVCTGSCINPDVKIDITFASKNSGRNVALNSNNRSLTFYRTPIYDSVEETCTSIGGLFSSATGNCTWTRLDATCAADGKVLVGFDASGGPICEAFPARDCPPPTWLVGFQANGDLICEVR